MDGTFVAFIAIGAVIAIVIGIASWHAKKKRQEQSQAFARSMGWQWIERDDSHARRWDGKPFGEGSSRRATNVLVGMYRGRPITVFDYTYTTESGGENRSTQTHRFTVWVTQLPILAPALDVRREGAFGGRVAAALGFGDLEVESEEFNRMFRVNAQDDRFGMAVLHPRMMEFLMATGPWPWRFDGNAMLSYEPDHLQPTEIISRFDVMADVLDRVPSFVWKDYGHQSA